MRARRAGRERPARGPSRFPAPSSSFRPTPSSRRSASGRAPSSSRGSTGSSSSTADRRRPGDRPHRRTRGIFAAGDATNGGATVVEAVREAQARRARRRGAAWGRCWRERDPLARARRPGREDGVAAARAALLRAGKSVQAFPEYGPERRGAPLRAYTRFDDRPIRRHDSIERAGRRRRPRAVARCTRPTSPTGSRPDGFVLVNAERAPAELDGRDVRCVPATRLAGLEFVNLVMVGARRRRARRAAAREPARRGRRGARQEGRRRDERPRRASRRDTHA